MLLLILIHVFYYLLALLAGFLIPRILKFPKWWIYCISIFLSILSALLLINIIKTITPSEVEIEIIEPKPGFVSDSHIVKVTGKISVFTSRFYILVHPSTTDQWWVQNKPQIFRAKSLEWKTECYIGTQDLGRNESYDIVAVASIDNIILDALAGRLLYPDQELKALPLLYKSNIITIKRAE